LHKGGKNTGNAIITQATFADYYNFVHHCMGKYFRILV